MADDSHSKPETPEKPEKPEKPERPETQEGGTNALAGATSSDSKVAIFGHPIHAMMVSFRVAMTMSALGADGFYWWTGDEFCARAALWRIGMTFFIGLAAGAAGTVEPLMVSGIRNRIPS